MAQVQKELSDVLVEQGLVSEEELGLAQQEESRTGTSAWKILLDRGTLTERDLVRARAAQIGMNFIDLQTEQPAPEALALVPEELARRQLVLPVRVENGTLLVAIADPRNHLALEEVAQLTGREASVAAAYRADLVAAIEKAYSAPPPPAQTVSQVVAAANVAPPPIQMPSQMPSPAPQAPAGAPAQAAPSVQVVSEAEEKEPSLADFLEAVLEGAGSDLHLTSGVPPMIRVHGELRPLKGYRRLFPKDIQEIIYAILTQRQRERFEEDLELDLSYSLPGRARFRVNVFQQRDALGAVMRVIPFEIKSAEDLGLPPSVSEFADLRRGLVLVTGVTGSGKSTTLAALVDKVNVERHEHIMTVEDPIEFLHKHKNSIVNQREVGTDTHGFAEALKHVLRQDPDVILVGEMRDLETIQTALTAAETGHLVFATLHTQDAPQSVDRVIDVFPPTQQQQIRIQLAGTLAGVCSQQLLPTTDGKGRVVASEVLVVTPAVRNLIREGKTHQIYTSMQAGGKFGMQVMDQHLAELVKRGKVSYEIGLERSHHVEEFNRLTGRG
ncbi:MAG: PilT/PilU family type 4a pilus ATPase [Actinomycetota bacterium]